jgi:hypothetical protein
MAWRAMWRQITGAAGHDVVALSRSTEAGCNGRRNPARGARTSSTRCVMRSWHLIGSRLLAGLVAGAARERRACDRRPHLRPRPLGGCARLRLSRGGKARHRPPVRRASCFGRSRPSRTCGRNHYLCRGNFAPLLHHDGRTSCTASPNPVCCVAYFKRALRRAEVLAGPPVLFHALWLLRPPVWPVEGG